MTCRDAIPSPPPKRLVTTRAGSARLTFGPTPYHHPATKGTNRAAQQTPTLYEWVGGKDALDRLIGTFYDRVKQDPVLGPVFAQMSPQHAAHVSQFIAEVIGGPKVYSEEHGGHAHMIVRHLGRQLTQDQRRR